MRTNYDVFAITGREFELLNVIGLTAVGGTGCSGLVLPRLKQAGDYAILAWQAGGLAVHPIKGSSQSPQVLTAHTAMQIEDLTLFILPRRQEVSTPDRDIIDETLSQMAFFENTEAPLDQLLTGIMKIARHEKGLVVSKNVSGQFEVLLGQNIATDQAWISEKMIQDCLGDLCPKVLNNVIGSQYNSRESLMSTGFLSVFCWPLMIQGSALGVLVTGSRRPHDGLSEMESQRIKTLVNLAAILSNNRLKELKLRREIEQLRSHLDEGPYQTQSSQLKQTCELARQVADSDLSVLVQGETGVGKEVMARFLHDHSSRSRGPFITVNCGAIPGELLESLLFGHKKGSFTNAYQDQTGKILQAHGGTLFLDEIGDLPHALQPKLLRVLNDKKVEPVGSEKSIAVDVRIVAATHKSLKDMVSQKTFRDDLYYRIAEMTLWIPPLRSRQPDILLIAHAWLKELKTNKVLSDEARQWLLGQPWTGNTRELKSVIKRAVVLCVGDEIKVEHFELGSESRALIRSQASELDWLGGADLEEAKQSFVLTKIHQALEKTAGNRTKAAQLLGVTPRTLFRYLEEDLKDLS